LTNPHNFTLTNREEALWEEFVDLARKERKTVSELIRSFIIGYVEARNLKVVVETKPEKIMLPNRNLKLLTYKGRLNPWPKDSELYSKWESVYGK